jgi:hypothetical protein
MWRPLRQPLPKRLPNIYASGWDGDALERANRFLRKLMQFLLSINSRCPVSGLLATLRNLCFFPQVDMVDPRASQPRFPSARPPAFPISQVVGAQPTQAYGELYRVLAEWRGNDPRRCRSR